MKAWVSEESAKNDEEGQLYFKLENRFFKSDIEVLLLVVDKYHKVIQNGLIMSYINRFNCFITEDAINDSLPIKTDLSDTPLIYTAIELDKVIQRNQDIIMRQTLKKKHDEECKECKECNDDKHMSKH